MTIEAAKKLENGAKVSWCHGGEFYGGTVHGKDTLGFKVKWDAYSQSSLFLYRASEVWIKLSILD